MIFVAVDPPMNGATQDFEKGYLSSGSPNKRINVVFGFKRWIQCSHGTTPEEKWVTVNSSYVQFIMYLFNRGGGFNPFEKYYIVLVKMDHLPRYG